MKPKENVASLAINASFQSSSPVKLIRVYRFTNWLYKNFLLSQMKK